MLIYKLGKKAYNKSQERKQAREDDDGFDGNENNQWMPVEHRNPQAGSHQKQGPQAMAYPRQPSPMRAQQQTQYQHQQDQYQHQQHQPQQYQQQQPHQQPQAPDPSARFEPTGKAVCPNCHEKKKISFVTNTDFQRHATCLKCNQQWRHA